MTQHSRVVHPSRVEMPEGINGIIIAEAWIDGPVSGQDM